MNKTLVKLIFAVVVAALFSCGNADGIEDDYEKLIGSEISIPYEAFKTIPCRMTSEQRKPRWTYVSFVDSLVCTPCHMSTVGKWDRIHDLFKKAETDVQITLMYCPRASCMEGLTENYMVSGCTRVVYIDSCARFLKDNPQVPQNRKMHTLLLDSTNHVVLIGDPTRNEKIERLMCEIIRKRNLDEPSDRK